MKQRQKRINNTYELMVCCRGLGGARILGFLSLLIFLHFPPSEDLLLVKTTNHSTNFNLGNDHYLIDASKLTGSSASLALSFVQLHIDESTKQFLFENKQRISLVRDLLVVLLQKYGGHSLTDANAITRSGRMFVFGDSHVSKLLTMSNGENRGGSLYLDVGAGDGLITKRLSRGFDKTIAIEPAKRMIKRLKEKGFIATANAGALFDEKIIGNHCYDLVSLLNVLDRVDKPLSMLRAVKKLIKREGRILLALVLPFRPVVQDTGLPPSEALPMERGASFESSVATLNEQVFMPLNLEIVKWTRLPYLCEGTTKRDYFVLNDAVFVLKNKPGEAVQQIIQPNISALSENYYVHTSFWEKVFDLLLL